VHEQALMRDLVSHIVAVAEAEGATRVTRVSVELGALSHLTPDHFREHYVDATRGTAAAGADVEAHLADDPTDARARDVVVLEVELEVP
jgi:hydrogenase nickel incorporation protein HypA/HybF